MINPVTVMKILNQRKEFLEHNPELYPFIQKWFGNGLQKGTVMEIKITPPDGEGADSVKIEVTDAEMGLLEAVKELFR